jgi:hypothetical protein
MSVGAAALSSQAYIAITITSTFPLVSSFRNYYPCFKAIKDIAEALSLNFASQVPEAPFSMGELLAAVGHPGNTSLGP